MGLSQSQTRGHDGALQRFRSSRHDIPSQSGRRRSQLCEVCHGSMSADRANGAAQLAGARCSHCHRGATAARTPAVAAGDGSGRGALVPAPARLLRPEPSEADAATDARLREASDELMTRLQQLRRLHPAELLLVREMIMQLNFGISAAATMVQPGASQAQISRCTSAWIVDEREHARSASAPCTICLEEFECGEHVRTLPCFHSFHCACVDAWFGKSRLCPLCQYDITSAPSLGADDAAADEGERADDAGAHASAAGAVVPTGVNLFSV